MAKYEYTPYERENYILDVRDRLDQKAIKTLMNRYGKIDERKKKLGDDYEAVQKKVNRICTFIEHKHL